MKDFILKYWVQELFALLGAGMGWLYKQANRRRAEQELIRSGLMGLLHDRIYQACQHHIANEYCTLEDRNNLEYMFRPYKALGGNGTGQELYERCMALPYRPE